MRVAALTIAAAAALLVPAGASATPPPGLSADGGFYGAAAPERLTFRAAQWEWTSERLAAAAPLDLAGTDVPTPAERPSPLAVPPETLKSTILDNPASYPNRVHGKLFGTFRGLGDYSCSATVVTSGSESLITSAGHCAYDPGRGIVATNLVFVPGYYARPDSTPYGVWPVRNLIVNKQWGQRGALDYDFSMMRTVDRPSGNLQVAVGSRGIGFDQPRKQQLQAFGYPANGNQAYNGNRLVLCKSGYIGDPRRGGGPRSVGMRCDQQQGSSGGGWVSQRSFVVSNTSHGYPELSDNRFYGPYYGSAAKSMYRAKTSFWPSIDPVTCNGRAATIVGSQAGDAIRGSGKVDVIATLGGDDRIDGGGGKDVICAGDGDDEVDGGGGSDRVDGGGGADACSNRGGDELVGCET